jgi:hypothetical protein
LPGASEGADGKAQRTINQMKISKVAAIAAIALTSVMAFNAVAQDHPQGGNTGQQKAPAAPGMRMADELGLNADQKAKWETVMKSEREKMKAVQEDKSLTKDQRREQMKSIREDMNKQLKAILTPEQQAKWEKMREERQPQGHTAPAKPESQK